MINTEGVEEALPGRVAADSAGGHLHCGCGWSGDPKVASATPVLDRAGAARGRPSRSRPWTRRSLAAPGYRGGGWRRHTGRSGTPRPRRPRAFHRSRVRLRPTFSPIRGDSSGSSFGLGASAWATATAASVHDAACAAWPGKIWARSATFRRLLESPAIWRSWPARIRRQRVHRPGPVVHPHRLGRRRQEPEPRVPLSQAILCVGHLVLELVAFGVVLANARITGRFETEAPGQHPPAGSPWRQRRRAPAGHPPGRAGPAGRPAARRGASSRSPPPRSAPCRLRQSAPASARYRPSAMREASRSAR